jgi:uncharacterized protein Yka (UPF0111/DUF47 family)
VRKYGLWKDLTFYFVLEAQAETGHRAAIQLQTILRGIGAPSRSIAGINELRAEADNLTSEFGKRLDSAFITPLDKEDLDALSCAFEEILNSLEEAAAHCLLISIPRFGGSMEKLADEIVDITTVIHESAGALRDKHRKKNLKEMVGRINASRANGKAGCRAAFAELFETEIPAKELVLWSDLLRRVETVFDHCGAAGNWIRRCAVKYA